MAIVPNLTHWHIFDAYGELFLFDLVVVAIEKLIALKLTEKMDTYCLKKRREICLKWKCCNMLCLIELNYFDIAFEVKINTQE